MRISDWSSDVCSSDLALDPRGDLLVESVLVCAHLGQDRRRDAAQLAVRVDPRAAAEARLGKPLLEPVEDRQHAFTRVVVALDMVGQAGSPPLLASAQTRNDQLLLRREEYMDLLKCHPWGLANGIHTAR